MVYYHSEKSIREGGDDACRSILGPRVSVPLRTVRSFYTDRIQALRFCWCESIVPCDHWADCFFLGNLELDAYLLAFFGPALPSNIQEDILQQVVGRHEY